MTKEQVTKEHLEYLDALRVSGVVNMFGAAPYVEKAFGLSKHDAKFVLIHWMNTFSERHP